MELPDVSTLVWVTSIAAYLSRKNLITPDNHNKHSKSESLKIIHFKCIPEGEVSAVVMVKSTRVVSGQLHRAGVKHLSEASCWKVRPPPVVPLPAALPLTEIASKAGPTKNNLDSAATLRTIVSVLKLAHIGRTSAAKQRTTPDNFNLTMLDRVASMWRACFKSNNRPRFKLGLHLLLETTTTVNWTDLRNSPVARWR